MGIVLGKGDYYGQVRSEYESTGIILSEYDYTAARTDWHYHENPYFMYLIQGELYDRNKRTETQCVRGDLMFHNWQESHWNQKESRAARGFHIEFDRSWYEKRQLDIDLWEGSQIIQDPRVHHILAKIYAEFRSGDAYSDLSIEVLLVELCESMFHNNERRSHKEPRWIGRLKELLQGELEGLDLTSLSHQLDIHPVHISRAVPKYLSCTLGSYIRDQRIKRSLDHLIDTSSEMSLTEIAFESGFSDQSHYSRVFRSTFGMTPGAYRKKII